MYCYVEKATRRILDASNITPWAHYLDPERHEIVEVVGDESAYAWPNGDRVRCLCTEAGQILPDPAWVDRDDVRDSYLAAKAAVEDMVANPTDLAKARTAIVKEGQCLQALLLYLNKRIA